MTCTVQTNPSAHFSTSFAVNGTDFPDLIEWIRWLPDSHLTQDYLSLAVTIRREIEPVITTSQWFTKGDNLPPEITQVKNFDHLRDALFEKLSPPFRLALQTQQLPLAEETIYIKTTEKANETSQSLLLTCRTDKNTSSSKLVCEEVIEHITLIKHYVGGPCTISAHAVMSESPHLFFLAGSEGFFVSEPLQDSIEPSMEDIRLEPTKFEPQQGVVYEMAFRGGDRETAMEAILFTLVDGRIRTVLQPTRLQSPFHVLESQSIAPFEIVKGRMITAQTLYPPPWNLS